MKRDVFGIVRKSAEGESDERKMSFVASNDTRDAYGTRVNPEGWNLERYKKNPIIAYGHRTSGWDNIDNIIGKGDVRVEGDELIVDITFEPAGANELADKVFQKLQFGTLNAVSVGFREIGQGRWGEGDEAITGKAPTYYYAGQELLEISIVPIPANPDAVKREFPEDLQAEIDNALKEVEKDDNVKATEDTTEKQTEEPKEKEGDDPATVAPDAMEKGVENIDAIVTLAKSYEY